MKDLKVGRRRECARVIHLKSQTFLNKISVYSLELLMPLIKANIAEARAR